MASRIFEGADVLNLTIAQFMAAAAFFTVGLTHLLIWSRGRGEKTHFIFALTALAAGANAIAESNMYAAQTVEKMAVAVKLYVAASGLWIVSLVWFIVCYARVGKSGRRLAMGLSAVFLAALVINVLAPNSLLYTRIDGLRTIDLFWGGQIRLADGIDNPLRFVVDLALLAVILLVINGCLSLKRRGQQARAWLFGVSLCAFMGLFVTHAMLVDTGLLQSPYLSTYGFLAVVLVMSYDLAGEVVQASKLSVKLRQKETDLQNAVADERSRIAGELHDSVTQTLFSTAAIADALPEVWDRYPEEARRGLNELRQLTTGALAEMRSLLLELRPAALLEKTLGELLAQLAEATAGRTRIPIKTEVAFDRRLPGDVQIALYRVAQESLNNVIKHARASRATIALAGDAQTVTLSISDDGGGFDPHGAPRGRLGLEIMRERLRSIGGSFEVETRPGQGTIITALWKDASRGGSND